MLLDNKNAVIYRGGGAIGGAVAGAFAREGAKVFLAGRTLAKLDRVAREISAAGGMAKIAEVGIRVICLRPHAIPDAVATSHTGEIFSTFSKHLGTTVEAMLAGWANTDTLLKRLPTLAEVANFAAFAASDRASAMTGAIANLTCGSIVDQRERRVIGE